MKNPYYYLFYRLNRFYNKKGDNEWGPIYGISLFPGWNIGIAYIAILRVIKEDFDGIYKTNLIVILASLFILNSILFLNKKRVNGIMVRYEKESHTSKRIGGWLIILYVLVSLGLVFL